MAIRKIAVLGAGNGGCAAAADLTLRGYEVRLYSRSEETLHAVLERGGIELVEAGEQSFARPELVTANIAAAVGGADLVMIAAPAIAHDHFAAGLAPHLRDGQILLLNPGHTGGSLHMASALRRRGLKMALQLSETATLTYICRLTGPAKVEIYRRTTGLRCAAFPGRFTARVVEEIGKIYPAVIEAENVMETGLANINAVMHPAGMVGNAGRIEQTGGNFFFYRDGLTPAIANIIDAVDRERLKIVEKSGLRPMGFVEIFHQAGLTSDSARLGDSVYRAIQESRPNQTIRSPSSLNHRYLKEDVAYGLVPMAHLARLMGVETPVMDSLIVLASAMNGVDYGKEGLTLEKMGLRGVKRGDLKSLLYEGFRKQF